MPIAWASFFAHCVSGDVFLPAARGGRFFAPPSSFSLPEKEERRARCRRKRGQSAFGLHHNSDRCSVSFVKYSFSCGLRPKAAAAVKSRASILWHLSGQNLCVCAKAMLSKRKAAMSVKVLRRSKFPLWRIFRTRASSLSAAAPLIK